MKRHGIISDLQINNKEERGAPIVTVLLFYIFTYALFKMKQSDFMLPPEIYDVILGVIVSLVASYVISKWYKLSIHMLGVCGVLGALMGLSMNYEFSHSFTPLFWIYILILIAGAVGWSRIHTKNHTFSEIITGALVGFIINYMIVI